MSTLVDRWGRPLAPDPPTDEMRQDAWANWQTGIGVWGQDKTKAAQYLPVFRVMDQELTSLMNGNDIARKIVSKRPEEMFRRGFAIEGDGDSGVTESDVDDIRDYATDYLDLENNLLEAMRWGRLYGGTLLIMGIDDGRYPWEPLDEQNIRSFNSLSLIDRRYSYVQSQYAAMGTTSKYGRAQVYLISNAVAGYGWDAYGSQKIEPYSTDDLIRQGAQVVLVHESRCLRFDGNPADVTTRQNLAGWSWSVLQVVYDAMRQFDGSFDSAAYLLSDASQGVFKLKGLMRAISSGNRASLTARLQLLEQSRSVMHGIALDSEAGEDFTRVQTPLTGIPDMLDKMMLRIASAADMPATELFGRAPAGLNATGESDTRKWYDTIASEQTNKVGPVIKRIFKLLALAKRGPLRGKPVKWKVKFHPLWAPTDKELADTRLANAQRDQIYLESGVAKPEEVAMELADVYPNMDLDAREKAIEGGVMFDPYENQPAPTVSALIAGRTEGEPLSSKAPVPLMGTSGTHITRGALPAVAAAEKTIAASHGAQSPIAGGKGGKGPRIGGSGSPNQPMEQSRATAERDKAKLVGETPSKGQAVSAAEGRPTSGDSAATSAPPSGNVYAGHAAIVIVWRAPGYVLTVSRPEPPHEQAIPGGMIDPGENPHAAAVRELEEETGLVVNELTSNGTVVSPEGRIVHVFTSHWWEGVPKAVEAGTVLAWLTPEQLVAQASTFGPCLSELAQRGALTPVKAFGGGNPGAPKVKTAPPDAPPNQSPAQDSDVLERQDAAALLALDALLAGRADADAARAVFEQLSHDYHAKDLGWVLRLEWSLQTVPLDRINFAARDRWRASHDGTLEGYVKKLRDGHVKPVILVEPLDPPDSKLEVVDGHHRTLANEALGRDAVAYVAKVPKSEGDWAHLHSLQKKGSSKLPDGGASSRGSSRDASRSDAISIADLPDDFGTAVPKQHGSKCADCRFFAEPLNCHNETFVAWASTRLHLPVEPIAGTKRSSVRIPAEGNDPRAYCCSAWQAAPGALSGGDGGT